MYPGDAGSSRKNPGTKRQYSALSRLLAARPRDKARPGGSHGLSSFCKKYAAPILLLISINLIVFSNKVSGQFLSDDFYILAQIEDFVFSFKNLIEFGISKPISIYFRPVVMVMWLILHKAFGQAPLYYHAVLLAFHIANALLVYFLLKRVVGKEAG